MARHISMHILDHDIGVYFVTNQSSEGSGEGTITRDLAVCCCRL